MDGEAGTFRRCSESARTRSRAAALAAGCAARARAESASGQDLPRSLHRAGVHIHLSGHGAARFSAPGDRLRAAALARPEQVAQALPGIVPQPRSVPRGLHARSRRSAHAVPDASLAAHRRVLVSARRHAHRRVLAIRAAAGRAVDSGPRGAGVSGKIVTEDYEVAPWRGCTWARAGAAEERGA